MPPQKNIPKERSFGDDPKEKDKQRARAKRERDKAAGEQLAAAVMDRVTKPPRFLFADGKFLWRDETTKVSRYRVNLHVQNDDGESIGGSTLIAASYFVRADEQGILSIV